MEIIIKYNTNIPQAFFETRSFYIANGHEKEALNNFLEELFPLESNKKKVFLIANGEEIFVTDSCFFSKKIFDMKYKKSTKSHEIKFYIMIFNTFQEAYSTANLMRSTDPKAFTK